MTIFKLALFVVVLIVFLCMAAAKVEIWLCRKD